MSTRLHGIGLALAAGVTLAGAACMVTRQNERFETREPIYDKDGKVCGYKTSSSESNTIEADVDDRLIDALPGVICNDDDDDEQDQLAGPAFGAQSQDAAPADPVHDWLEHSPPFSPSQVPHTGDRDEPVEVPLLQSITLDDMSITLNLKKTTITDADVLAFTMVWNVDTEAGARQVILETFDHASFPDDRTITYAGPAPEGFDLAALLGMSRIEMIPGTLQVGFDSPAEADSWDKLSLLIMEISPAQGTVSVNGTVVLQLTERAAALDALNPA